MRSVVIGSIMLVLAGCGTSRQAEEVDVAESGFLGDAYARLEPGDPSQGESLRVWLDPAAPWASYDKVIVDQVEFWGTGTKSDIPREDRETLGNYLRGQLMQELGKDFQLVEDPGPNTLRVAAALTDAEAANQTMTAASSVLPPAIVLSSAYEYVTDEPSWQGQAAAELKMTDAVSGAVLAAGVDRRIGGRTLESAESSWEDVHNIMTTWAQFARFRLCKLQGRSGCEMPRTGGL